MDFGKQLKQLYHYLGDLAEFLAEPEPDILLVVIPSCLDLRFSTFFLSSSLYSLMKSSIFVQLSPNSIRTLISPLVSLQKIVRVPNR